VLSTLRIAIQQMNMVLGDFHNNRTIMEEGLARSEEAHADVLLFPELTICGYPPEDLLMRPSFLKENKRAIQTFVEGTAGKKCVAVFGGVDITNDLYNSAFIVRDGTLLGVYRKMRLPNYGVFDEARYFNRGDRLFMLNINGIKAGITICEDIWTPGDPVATYVAGGANVILNLSASPYEIGKIQKREEMLRTRATDYRIAIAYANAVGGQDEILFDGSSFMIDGYGRLACHARSFEEDFVISDVDIQSVIRLNIQDPRRRYVTSSPLPIEEIRVISPTLESKKPLSEPNIPSKNGIDLEEEIFRGLQLALRDYLRKNGFETIVLGLSGGMDSAFVATIGTFALGSEHVVGVLMPSEFTRPESSEDAVQLANNLGIQLIRIPIHDVFRSYQTQLHGVFGDAPFGLTEENLQARIRGNDLMALSNRFGWLVVTTGNKSEIATGYSTLYGDSAGGFAPIKDLYKTMIYRVARWINDHHGAPIPQRIFDKPPSAELRADQTDQDRLPAYEVLDPILRLAVEEDRDEDEIIASGFDPVMVRDVIGLIEGSEYKRRQSPIGPKLTAKGFGKDRRIPITYHRKPS